MYKVLCDGALMCDSQIEELALIKPVVTQEENKAGSFSFTIPPAHPMYDAVAKRKSLVQVYQDAEMVFSGICIEEKKDFYKQKTVYCEGELTFFNDSVQRPARYQGISVRGLLEAYVANHNAQVEEAKRFTVGVVTVTDPNDYIYCYTNMESTMQALKEDLVDDLGGFFRIRHADGVRYLDYLAESQNTNSQVIKLGKNLLDFTSNIDSSDIATAIIPLGARLEESPVEGLEVRLTIESANDGVDYVHSPEAVENYGWIYKTVEWDGVTTPEALKRKGEQYLSDVQFENMVIKAKAVDLHLTDKEIEQFKISDQIHVISAPHGLDRYFRLTKMTIYLNNPEKNTITLGKDERLTLSAKSNQASEEIKKAIESIVPADEMLKRATKNATTLITSAMGGYVVKTNDELLIMDTPDIETATKVWRWNINGLGYSSTGYNGEYALAMTMDGRFVADGITVEGLEVGKNVTMGADATISFEQVKGGTNMLLNTKRMDANWGGRMTHTYGVADPDGGNEAHSLQGTSDSDSFWGQESVAVFKEPGKYVVSFWAKASKAFSLPVSGGDTAYHYIDLSTEWKEYKVQFDITEVSRPGFYFGGWYTWTDTEVVVDIYRPMLESGETETLWTPSPYDEMSEEQVTKITRDTVTTEYVNALGVKAKSVDAENITGKKIKGKTFEGGEVIGSILRSEDADGFIFKIEGGTLSIYNPSGVLVFEITATSVQCFDTEGNRRIDMSGLGGVGISFYDTNNAQRLAITEDALWAYDSDHNLRTYIGADGIATYDENGNLKGQL